MDLRLLLLSPLLLYLLLLAVTPRGNVLYEALRLPLLWYRLWRAPRWKVREARHPYGGHPRQYLLSFQPMEGSRLRPLTVVYFHGGGWRFGSPEHFRANAHVLARHGYHVILPSYRRLPRFGFPDIHEDLLEIRRTIRSILKKEGKQGHAVVIGGMSAGGHVAAFLGLAESGPHPLLPLRGLFYLGAPLDLRQMPDSRTLRQLAGPRDSDTFRAANPPLHLDDSYRFPSLFIHGEKDGMVPLPAGRSFAEMLKAKTPAPVTFHLIPGGTHLDAVRWAYQDGPQRKLLLDWLGVLSSEF